MTRKLRRLMLIGVGALIVALCGATLIAAYTPLTERTIYTEATVDAPGATVWLILADLGEYSV